MFVRIICTKEIQVELLLEVSSLDEAEEIGNNVDYDHEDESNIDYMVDVEEISEKEYIDCTTD